MPKGESKVFENHSMYVLREAGKGNKPKFTVYRKSDNCAAYAYKTLEDAIRYASTLELWRPLWQQKDD